MKQTMIACLLFAGFLIQAQTVNTDTLRLRELIHAGLERYHIQSLSITIVKDSSFFFQKGYGRTNILLGPAGGGRMFDESKLSKEGGSNRNSKSTPP